MQRRDRSRVGDNVNRASRLSENPSHRLDVFFGHGPAQRLSRVVQRARQRNSQHRQESIAHPRVFYRRLGFFDLVTKALAELRRFRRSLPALGVERSSSGSRDSKSDAQLARIGAYFFQERPLGW